MIALAVLQIACAVGGFVALTADDVSYWLSDGMLSFCCGTTLAKGAWELYLIARSNSGDDE